MSTWIERHLDVLFQRDARGRLVATRDPEPRSAPWLFLGWQVSRAPNPA